MNHDTQYIRTSVSLPPVVNRWLKKRAAKFGLTVSAYVVQLCIEDMKQSEREAINGDNRQSKG